MQHSSSVELISSGQKLWEALKGEVTGSLCGTLEWGAEVCLRMVEAILGGSTDPPWASGFRSRNKRAEYTSTLSWGCLSMVQKQAVRSGDCAWPSFHRFLRSQVTGGCGHRARAEEAGTMLQGRAGKVCEEPLRRPPGPGRPPPPPGTPSAALLIQPGTLLPPSLCAGLLRACLLQAGGALATSLLVALSTVLLDLNPSAAGLGAVGPTGPPPASQGAVHSALPPAF